MSELSAVQVNWQSAALHALFVVEDGEDFAPWIKSRPLVQAISEAANCTTQAATGALRSLLAAGLAERAETSDGVFWRPSDAAERAFLLLIDCGQERDRG